MKYVRLLGAAVLGAFAFILTFWYVAAPFTAAAPPVGWAASLLGAWLAIRIVTHSSLSKGVRVAQFVFSCALVIGFTVWLGEFTRLTPM